MSGLVPVLGVLVVALAGCLTPASDAPVSETVCSGGPLTLEQDVEVSNLRGGGRVGPSATQDVPIELNETLPFACIRSITASLSWTNTPTSGADLYLGLEAPAAGVSVLGHDDQQLVGDGAHQETVAAPVAASKAPELVSGLTVVIRSDWASASSSGLPAHLVVEFGLADD